MSIVRAWNGRAPRLDESVFVADDAVVIGDVEVGAGSSIWFGTLVRGDVNHIRIGRRTNVQDHCIVHVSSGTHPTEVGDDVTLGHRVTLHGCTIKDRCLVGIGAVVLDGAVVGESSIVGAGALVPPGMVVPPGMLAVGAPARVKRELTPEEVEFFVRSAERYRGYAEQYRREGWGAR